MQHGLHSLPNGMHKNNIIEGDKGKLALMWHKQYTLRMEAHFRQALH